MYKEYGTAPPALEELAQLYRKVDTFAIVSGEYNHGIPLGLKNLLDDFLEEYFFRPSAIVWYSARQFGGVRAAMQLRMTLGRTIRARKKTARSAVQRRGRSGRRMA